MPKNSITGTPGQETNLQLVYGLLATICTAVGHTFSWYTSKKGRTWLAIKCNQGAGYTTNVEYSNSLSDQETFEILAILMYHHVRKYLEIAPPVTSWVNGKASTEERLVAARALGSLTSQFVERCQLEGMAILPSIQSVIAESGFELDQV